MTDLTITSLDLDLIRKIRANFTVRQYRFRNVGNGIFRAVVDLSKAGQDDFSISFHRSFKNLDAARRYAIMIRAAVAA